LQPLKPYILLGSLASWLVSVFSDGVVPLLW